MEPEELEEERHSHVMEEIQKQKENIELKAGLEKQNARLYHDLELERMRIERAEHRKDDAAWMERQKELHMFKSEHWNTGRPFFSNRGQQGHHEREEEPREHSAESKPSGAPSAKPEY